MKDRKSVKLFDNSKLEDSVIKDLVEMCNLTPTSLGIQPVRVITVSSDEVKDLLSPHAYNQPQIKSCSHLVVLSIMSEIDEEYIDNYIKLISEARGVSEESLSGFRKMISNWFLRNLETDYLLWAKNQAYLTLGVLISQLAVKGIDACAMEGFLPVEFDKILGLQAMNLQSVIICAVGNRSEECPRGKEAKVRLPIDVYNPVNFD